MIWWRIRLKLSKFVPHWWIRFDIRLARWRTRSDRPPLPANPRLLVDVTTIARHDRGTGIQRVVRSIITQMILHPDGWDVRPIRYEGKAFRHTAWPGPDSDGGAALHPAPGDVFLALDLSLDAIRRQLGWLLRHKRRGARVWFVVYDLLALQFPELFSAKLAVRFRLWLIASVKLADGYICISPHVAEDVRAFIVDRLGVRAAIKIAVIPMGFDFAVGGNGPVAVGRPAPSIDMTTAVLSVGTLEPRKGYALLIDTFELLWARGFDTELVIVGAPGWKTEQLQQRILSHVEFDRRLHWLTDIDDRGLATLYDNARLLVAASYGEGFGLPVLEAIARSCPVLARDIPAFRVHEGYGLQYFKADADADDLATALVDHLRDDRRAAPPGIPGRLPRWRDAAAATLAVLAGRSA